MLTPGLLLLLAAALLAGTLIGAVGVGGVLIAPLLVLLAGYDVHQAVAIASWSFMFTGAVGTLSYARRGSINWPVAAWLAAGVLPAAVLGALVNTRVPDTVVTVIISVLVVASGLRELMPGSTSTRTTGGQPGKPTLLLLGALVGFGSALTGTGGPVLLIPLLMLTGMQVLNVIGVAQAIQLPVAAFASLGYLLFGQIDLPVATALGLTQAAGVMLGARLAHRLNAVQLRRLVASALIGTAMLLLVQL